MLKTLATLLLLALAAGATAPAVSYAQDGSRVRELIEQNGELLDAATALVNETNSLKARSSLVTARELHARSIELLNQGAFAMAARVAFRAREVIQQTIMIAKRDARLEEQAQKAIERAALRLDQARSALDEAGTDQPAPRRLLHEAVDNLRQAREQMQEHRFAVALRLADASAALSMRALRMVRGDAPGTLSQDDVRDELERTDRVIEHLTDVRGDLPSGLTASADQATDMQRRARASASDNALERAREETLAARELALRALRVLEPQGGDPENAQAILEQTDELLARAGDAVTGSAPRALDEARDVQASARRSLAAGNPEAATKQSLRARDMVRSLLDEAAANPRTVEAALARTDESLARLAEQLADKPDPRGAEMLENARARQSEARRAVADGDPRRALALTRVATRIARDAMARTGDAVR